jgi:hypothetical protein
MFFTQTPSIHSYTGSVPKSKTVKCGIVQTPKGKKMAQEAVAVIDQNNCRRSKLCMRTVPQDGNEFYVLASIVLYGVHDKHQEIRRRLWDVFCRAVLGESLETLQQGQPGNLNVEHPWFAIWMMHYAPPWLSAQPEITINNARPDLETAVRRYACVGTVAPFSLACALMARVHGTGIVFYNAGRSLTEEVASQDWHPERVWEPPSDTLPPIPYMHLMQRRGALQLLVNLTSLASQSSHDENDIRNRIPTHPVTALPLRLRTDMCFEPAASKLVEDMAVYRLGVYDSMSRKCSVAGHFVSPATGFNKRASSIHYLRIDTAMRKDHLIFTIQGCVDQTEPVPLYIFACRTVAGQTLAECIGHWPVDLCSPRISLRNQDHTILLVPGAANADAAARCVTHQWGCVAYTGRSEVK